MSEAPDPPTRDEPGLVTRKQLLGGAGVLAGAAAMRVDAPADAHAELTGRTVEYWVAAIPVDWNIAPNQRDAIEGRGLEPSATVVRTVVYRQFTPGWKRQVPPDPVMQNGIAGPVFRGRVGDTLRIHFRNMDTERKQPHSMHFHGVHYRFESDGAYIPGFSGKGASVAPGETYTYTLRAESDSVGTWPYHDHSPSMHESIRGGMYGALIIEPRRAPRIDRDFLIYFSHFNEFMTINGRAFVGNTPVFSARKGERVRWNVLAIGEDFHTFHIHGHRWRRRDGTFEDTRTIGPAESFAIDFVEDAPGTWLYHCHVEAHMAAGMIGIYRVAP